MDEFDFDEAKPFGALAHENTDPAARFEDERVPGNAETRERLVHGGVANALRGSV
jgi:hypothetical protein